MFSQGVDLGQGWGLWNTRRGVGRHCKFLSTREGVVGGKVWGDFDQKAHMQTRRWNNKGQPPSSRDFLMAVSREPAGRKERQWLGFNID